MNRRTQGLLLALVLAATSFTATNRGLAQSVEDKVDQALLAAPESLRDDATVVEYAIAGQRTTLRQGTNSLVCEPDKPEPGFRVQCYHKSWQPVRDRMQKWAADGKTAEESLALFDEALASGELEDFVPGAIQYLLAGPDGESAELRLTIRLPNATAESVGIPTQERTDGPWLMWAGTPRAHIMLPSRPKQ